MFWTTIIRRTVTGIMQSVSGFAEPISRALGLRIRTAAGSTVQITHDDTVGKIESTDILYLKGETGIKFKLFDTPVDGADHENGDLSFYQFVNGEVAVRWRTVGGVSKEILLLIPDESTIEALSDGTFQIKDGGVSLAKMANLANMKLVGNVSGSTGTPAAVSILDEDDMTSNSAEAVPTQQSVKAYIDGLVPDPVTILDEDDMFSDSATAVPTQQSVKAYIDGAINTAITNHLAVYH